MSVYDEAVKKLGHLGESHLKMLQLVPRGAKVLEVGPSSGYFTAALRSERAPKLVDGVEFDKKDAEAAQEHLDKLIIGSIEDEAILNKLADNHYDSIILGDVIEHLHHPEATLRALRAKLSEGGLLIISTPNIAHISIRASLVRGKFDYTDTGILDKTHTRIYTKRALTDILERTGYKVATFDMTYFVYRGELRARSLKFVGPFISRGIDKVAPKLPGLLAYQFIVSAERGTTA